MIKFGTDEFQDVIAADFCEDHELAVRYLQHVQLLLPSAAEPVVDRVMKPLVWRHGGGSVLVAELHGGKVTIVTSGHHDYTEWGVWSTTTGEDDSETKLFETIECFVAYVVARWW